MLFLFLIMKMTTVTPDATCVSFQACVWWDMLDGRNPAQHDLMFYFPSPFLIQQRREGLGAHPPPQQPLLSCCWVDSGPTGLLTHGGEAVR